MQECKRNFHYSFELQRVKTISKRKERRQNRLNSYVNPITRAIEYERMLKEKNLNQNQLAKELGLSRVRVTQILNLLKLPIERQNYILEHGKEKFITEKSLRKNIPKTK